MIVEIALNHAPQPPPHLCQRLMHSLPKFAITTSGSLGGNVAFGNTHESQTLAPPSSSSLGNRGGTTASAWYLCFVAIRLSPGQLFKWVQDGGQSHPGRKNCRVPNPPNLSYSATRPCLVNAVDKTGTQSPAPAQPRLFPGNRANLRASQPGCIGIVREP